MTAMREVAVVPADLGTPYERLKPGPGKPAPEVAEHQRARIHAAMIDLVGTRGYEKVTARELTRLSGVSTRSFYKHFESKEDCFARTYQLVVRRMVRRIDAAQAGGRSWQKRLRLAVEAFAHEVAHDPYAGRLALVDVYAMGPVVAFRHLRSLERAFTETVKAGSPFAADEEDSSLLIEGAVSGIISVTRSRLLSGKEDELPAQAGRLADWALSLRGAPPAGIVDPPSSASWKMRREGVRTQRGERAVLLSAVTRLMAADGYEVVTERAIHEVAGTSGRSFAAHFESVEDCFLAAVEERTREALARAAGAQESAPSWAAGVHRAIASICAEVSDDPVLAAFNFEAVFAAGVRGLECREQLMSDLVQLLRQGASPHVRLDDLALEASVGAVWSILGHCVIEGPARRARQLSPTLAYLVLAPAVGADLAATVISRQHNFPGSSSLPEPIQSIEQKTGVTQSCTGIE